METSVVYDVGSPEELLELYRTHWWFEGRDPDDVRRSVNGSDEFVGLRAVGSGRLVASARVITDYVYTGKVLDVIVDGSLRRRGVGKRLMGAVTDHPELQDVEELTLNCREGLAPFYEACGFRLHDMIEEGRDGSGEDYYVMVYS
jgi:GNAT superfamily N-acetyltransferase